MRMLQNFKKDTGCRGVWPSPPVLETGKREFKSRHPDHLTACSSEEECWSGRPEAGIAKFPTLTKFDRGVMDRHDPRATNKVHVERVT